MWDVMMIAAAVVGLWVGTEIAVRACGELGRRFGISEMFLGLTVFTIGTNVSERTVSLSAAARIAGGAELSGLVLGNALGSVLAQGGLVLGVLFFLGGAASPESESSAKTSAWAWLGATFLLSIYLRDGRVGTADGVVLTLVYVGFFVHTCRATEWRDNLTSLETVGPGLLLIGTLAVGLVSVVLSADLAVEHSTALADRSSVDPTAIGLFALGAGTSMPELAVSTGALARGRPALSLGNILGSNIFDLLVPIGIAALVHPLDAGRNVLRVDLPAIAIFAVFFNLASRQIGLVRAWGCVEANRGILGLCDVSIGDVRRLTIETELFKSR